MRVSRELEGWRGLKVGAGYRGLSCGREDERLSSSWNEDFCAE